MVEEADDAGKEPERGLGAVHSQLVTVLTFVPSRFATSF